MESQKDARKIQILRLPEVCKATGLVRSMVYQHDGPHCSQDERCLRELTAIRRLATSLPFLDLEPGHGCEVPHIVRYDGRFLRHGMRGDHQIEITDRLACALERRADARIVESHRIRPVGIARRAR